MTDTLRAHGQWHHHFHGEYTASITLVGDRQGLREQIAHALPKAPGARVRLLTDAVAVSGTTEALAPITEWIEAHRVDGPCPYARTYACKTAKKGERHGIGSCAHSIDHGPVFAIEWSAADLLTPLLPFPPVAPLPPVAP